MNREQKLEEALRKVADTLDSVAQSYNGSCEFASVDIRYGLLRSCVDDARAALSAPKAEAVAVKPLEWVRGWMEAEAETEVGLYKIRYRRDGSFEWSIGTFKRWSSSWDSAIAAAQADYAARILSAIDTSPVPALTDEAVERVTHRHKKRGSEYVLIGIGKMQASDWFDLGPPPEDDQDSCVDMREVAIYRGVEDGSLWVRPREDFEDGRFEVLAAFPSKGEGE